MFTGHEHGKCGQRSWQKRLVWRRAVNMGSMYRS